MANKIREDSNRKGPTSEIDASIEKNNPTKDR